MQVNSHEASRIRKRDQCKLVFSRTDEFDGLLLSVIDKKEFEKSAGDWLEYEFTAAIWEGRSQVIIAYK